jgi:hypothetical protein
VPSLSDHNQDIAGVNRGTLGNNNLSNGACFIN